MNKQGILIYDIAHIYKADYLTGRNAFQLVSFMVHFHLMSLLLKMFQKLLDTFDIYITFYKYVTFNFFVYFQIKMSGKPYPTQQSGSGYPQQQYPAYPVSYPQPQYQTGYPYQQPYG